ncbi:hypothetical protein WN48_03480 [Eufriesea mexicana]|uniref:Uncharacterized protein n=1 Tax=Eufriesea mexicana TaxID=516756 RepID=A0A310SAL9_9HYME|nr:hypothetical protein WN48_03480 [Eufriesea mexicana]
MIPMNDILPKLLLRCSLCPFIFLQFIATHFRIILRTTNRIKKLFERIPRNSKYYYDHTACYFISQMLLDIEARYSQ